MPRNQTRGGLDLALRLAEIDEPSPGAKVNDNIQMTYQLGDFTELLPILPVPRGFIQDITPTNVVRRSAIELAPPPDAAIVVEFIRNVTGGAVQLQFMVRAPLLTADQILRSPDFVTGILTVGELRSIVTAGTTTVPPIGFTLDDATTLDLHLKELLVIPGRVLVVEAIAINTAIEVQIAWRELPRAPLITG